MRRIVLTVALVFALALPAAASARVRLVSITSPIRHGSYATVDPPRIVPWHMIGNVGLGMSLERIKYIYGAWGTPGVKATQDLAQKIDTFAYPVSGGRLAVDFHHGHVAQIWTNSPRYRTADGVGVGSRIPLGPCHWVKGHCEHRWHGFVLGYAEGGGNSWLLKYQRGGRTVWVELYVDRGVIEWVSIAYQDYLACSFIGECR